MAYIVIGQPSYIVRSCLKRKEAGGKGKRRKEGGKERGNPKPDRYSWDKLPKLNLRLKT